MKTIQTCGQCGKPLPAGSPQGLCPECLLRAGLEPNQIAAHSSTGQTTANNIVNQTTVAERPGTEPKNAGQARSAPERLHYFGDYELLEEIAQGGMGVIYKARQVSLNRIVAVKMILAGEFATEAEVKRFRVEAEAAANLQHPNIVAIHEVGVHEGRHYFSMDYVAGKNLAQTMAEKPLLAGQAAALLKTLAEAVHYAHQRGTLHRDLKPQNVLLDEQGQPRITDFGLAKRVREDSGLTRSGAVMGSPSYMPPEQAAGRWGELGPHSDVYALGAILYEMLTGRAPFKRETVTATLVQVLEEEPVHPRQLNPAVPMDLETICLKCMEKRPERRYASARALAEELDRFLRREPILAKPASAARKAWGWGLRHPWAVTGVITVLFVGLIGLAYGLWEQSRYWHWQAAHPTPSPETTGAFAFLIDKGDYTRIKAVAFTAWLGLSILLGPLTYFDYVQRKTSHDLISRRLCLGYCLLGLLAIALGAFWALRTIHIMVWEKISAPNLVPLLFTLCGCWSGLMLLWHATHELQVATFGGSNKDESEPYHSGKLPRNAGKWTFAALLVLTQIGTFLGQMTFPDQGTLSNMWALRWAYFWIEVPVTCILPLLCAYLKIRHPVRHFFMLLIVLCVIFSLLYSVRPPLQPADITMWQIRLAQLAGLAWGLIAGGILTYITRWEIWRSSTL